MCEKLKIPQSIIEALIAHAREEFPLEVCGILGGIDTAVSRMYRLSNAAASATRFQLNPHEHAGVMRDLLQRNLETIAFYHSHPSGPSYPSVEDVRLAYYPDVATVIISLEDRNKPAVEAFFIRDGLIEVVAMEVEKG
ncbi:MAG: M67 family metallopeptidase [Geobacteraceae bacterium]|nr:M67 family metallopeptidase [Geobacteraceae bacterium]